MNKHCIAYLTHGRKFPVDVTCELLPPWNHFCSHSALNLSARLQQNELLPARVEDHKSFKHFVHVILFSSVRIITLIQNEKTVQVLVCMILCDLI